MSTQVTVERLPRCDVHPDRDAAYDTKTTLGPWMSACRECYVRYGVGRLGTGYGQKYVLAPAGDNSDVGEA